MKTPARIIAVVGRLSRLPARWLQAIDTRERLGAKPVRLLADIGLDRAAVALEAGEPFWRPFGQCLAAGALSARPATSASAPVPAPALLQLAARFPGATFPMLS